MLNAERMAQQAKPLHGLVMATTVKWLKHGATDVGVNDWAKPSQTREAVWILPPKCLLTTAHDGCFRPKGLSICVAL